METGFKKNGMWPVTDQCDILYVGSMLVGHKTERMFLRFLFTMCTIKYHNCSIYICYYLVSTLLKLFSVYFLSNVLFTHFTLTHYRENATVAAHNSNDIIQILIPYLCICHNSINYFYLSCLVCLAILIGPE